MRVKRLEQCLAHSKCSNTWGRFFIVAVAVVIFNPPLPLRPQLPPPQCQPVTWNLPHAQSGFNWELKEMEGDVRGPSLSGL